MTNNLWEIINFDDLVYLLKNAQNKFIVLSITTEDTDNNIKKLIKKTIKEKSKTYPKVTFLLYKAKHKDFGKLQPMFDKDITQYPKMFHIWNIQEIMTGVIAIDNKEIIESSFEDFHDVYLDGKLPNETGEKQKDNEDEDENELEHKNKEEENKNKIKVVEKQNNIQNQKQIPIPIPIQNKDPILEKKKMTEKINLLRQKQEECTLEFLSEFKKRKEEEEGVSEKKRKTK